MIEIHEDRDRRAAGRLARGALRRAARAVDPRRAGLVGAVDAVPRARRRRRARPPRLRPQRQARRPRLLDRRLRGLARALLRARRDRAPAAGDARLGRRRAGARAAGARADRADRRDRHRAAAARLPLAPVRARLAHAGRGRDRDGARRRPGACAGCCRPAAPSPCWRTSIPAPSGRSCGSTAPARRRCSRPPAARSARSTLRRSCCTARATATSRPASPTGSPRRWATGAPSTSRGPGHWPWLDRPELVERVARFLAG